MGSVLILVDSLGESFGTWFSVVISATFSLVEFILSFISITLSSVSVGFVSLGLGSLFTFCSLFESITFVSDVVVASLISVFWVVASDTFLGLSSFAIFSDLSSWFLSFFLVDFDFVLSARLDSLVSVFLGLVVSDAFLGLVDSLSVGLLSVFLGLGSFFLSIFPDALESNLASVFLGLGSLFDFWSFESVTLVWVEFVSVFLGLGSLFNFLIFWICYFSMSW